MGFNYRHTCPIIDDNIKQFKEMLLDELTSLLADYDSNMSDDEKKEYVNDYCRDIYKNSEHIFEKIRSSNVDIRKEADYQIEMCNQDVDQLRDDIAYTNAELRDKDEVIDELRSTIVDLEYKLNRIINEN